MFTCVLKAELSQGYFCIFHKMSLAGGRLFFFLQPVPRKLLCICFLIEVELKKSKINKSKKKKTHQCFYACVKSTVYMTEFALFLLLNEGSLLTCLIVNLIVFHLQHIKWRLSTVNNDYSVCPSYPLSVIVPKVIDDDTLKKVAKFRQAGRFPVLCYYHRKNGMVSC